MAIEPGQPATMNKSATNGTLFFKNIYFDDRRRTVSDPM